jgi:hypothetical protein
MLAVPIRLKEGSRKYIISSHMYGFRVEGHQPARLLLCAQGGSERFIVEMSEPAPPAGPPDMERLIALAAQYHIDILGPLPE